MRLKVVLIGMLSLVLLALVAPVMVIAGRRNLASIALSKAADRVQASVLDPLDDFTVKSSPESGPREGLARLLFNASAATRQEVLYYLLAGQAGQAEMEIRIPRTIEAPDPLTAIALASALYRNGARNEAVALWREARAAKLLVYYGNGALSTNNPKKAVELFNLAVEIDPGDGWALLGLAELHRKLGQGELAISHFRKAFELGAQSSDGAQHLAKLLAERGHYVEAELWLKQALTWRPDYVPYVLDLADLYLILGRDTEAELLLARAAQLAPANGWVHVKYGYYLVSHGRLAEGLDEIRRGIALEPNSRDAWAVLGRVYLNDLRDTAKAVEAFERVVALDPQYAWAHLALGDAYRGQGRIDLARAAYMKALALQPDYAEARSRLAQLAAEGVSIP